MYEKVCPVCGRRLSEFYNTSMLGCPKCYDAFRSEIIVALRKIQGKDFHVGKAPEFNSLDKELLNEYQILLKQKEQAALERRFQDMCAISEDILELKAELKRRGLI
jgi:protein arginine kinase activator